MKTKEKRISSKPTPWLSSSLKELYRQRNYMKSQMKRADANFNEICDEYKKLRNRCTHMYLTKKAKADYFRNSITCTENKENQKLFGRHHT